MLTLVRRQPQQPRARFTPRSSPRFARRAPASPAQARGSPFADALTAYALRFATSASATAPPSAHCRSQCSRHSCGRSCGARPHFARHCLAQCAPHRQPLNRRGGSDPPGSPASIFRSFIQRESTIRPAGPALGSTPHASVMLACHGAPCPAFSMPFGVKQGQAIVGPSGCSGEPRPSYWNRFCFFGAVLWRTAQSGPGFSGEPSIQARGSLENRPIPGHIGPSPTEFSVPAGPQRAVSGREPAAFSSETWSSEPRMQRIFGLDSSR